MEAAPAKNAPFKAWEEVDFVNFTVGTKSGNVINLAMAFKRPDGVASDESCCLRAYLSSQANGLTLASAPSGGIAIGTNGLLNTLVTNQIFDLISTSTGLVDVNITQTTGVTFYLVLVMPNGKIVVSPAVAF